ncbi:MAG: ribosomal RNA small subunit methyltransferase A [Thermoplasmata archaeon]|nr:ribosomal RNA small subunit methyltransferase A [Thermoplasmata archaeon]
MNVSEIQGTLGKLGIRPSRKRSQNFLLSEDIARWQVEAAGIRDDDKVLEIGPGLGILSKYILEKTNNAVFIEKEPALAKFIENEYGANVICGDALETDLSGYDVIISNLPYHISSEITVRVLRGNFRTAILMYQKEFAAHLTASPGSRDFSRISVFREFYAEAEVIKQVSKSNYYPVPKVDSSIVKLSSREPPFQPDNIDHYFNVVRMLFSHKKRTVRNALLSEAVALASTKKELKPKLESLPFSDDRVFKLAPEDINKIAEFIYNLNN